MEAIKNCPFCGGKAALRKKNRTIIQREVRRNCYVHCLSCDARGPRFLEGSSTDERISAREKAIRAWNQRERVKDIRTAERRCTVNDETDCIYFDDNKGCTLDPNVVCARRRSDDFSCR